MTARRSHLRRGAQEVRATACEPASEPSCSLDGAFGREAQICPGPPHAADGTGECPGSWVSTLEACRVPGRIQTPRPVPIQGQGLYIHNRRPEPSPANPGLSLGQEAVLFIYSSCPQLRGDGGIPTDLQLRIKTVTDCGNSLLSGCSKVKPKPGQVRSRDCHPACYLRPFPSVQTGWHPGPGSGI